MVKITPHIYIGNHVDMYNTLYGIGNSEISAVLDCTSELPSSKWKKNKSITLKKVGIKPEENITKTIVNRSNEFIKGQLKIGNAVLIACKQDYIRSYVVALSYFINAKSMSIEEAIEKINIGIPPKLNEDSLKVLKRLHDGI